MGWEHGASFSFMQGELVELQPPLPGRASNIQGRDAAHHFLYSTLRTPPGENKTTEGSQMMLRARLMLSRFLYCKPNKQAMGVLGSQVSAHSIWGPQCSRNDSAGSTAS